MKVAVMKLLQIWIFFIFSKTCTGVPVGVLTVPTTRHKNDDPKSHGKPSSTSYIRKPSKTNEETYSQYFVYRPFKEADQNASAKNETLSDEYDKSIKQEYIKERRKHIQKRDTSPLKELKKNLNKLLLHQLHKETITTIRPSRNQFFASNPGIISSDFANVARANSFKQMRNFVNDFLGDKINTGMMSTNFVKGMPTFDTRKTLLRNFQPSISGVNKNMADLPNVQTLNVHSHSEFSEHDQVQTSVNTQYTKAPSNMIHDHGVGTSRTTQKYTKQTDPTDKTTVSIQNPVHNNSRSRDIFQPRPTLIPYLESPRNTQSAIDSTKQNTFTKILSSSQFPNVTPTTKAAYAYTSKAVASFNNQNYRNVSKAQYTDPHKHSPNNALSPTPYTEVPKVNGESTIRQSSIQTTATSSKSNSKSWTENFQRPNQSTKPMYSFTPKAYNTTADFTRKPSPIGHQSRFIQKPSYLTTASPLRFNSTKSSPIPVPEITHENTKYPSSINTTSTQRPNIKLDNLLYLQGIHILFTHDKPNYTEIDKNPTLHLTASIKPPSEEKGSANSADRLGGTSKVKQVTRVKSSTQDVQFSTMSENKYVGTALIRNGHLFLVIYSPDGKLQQAGSGKQQVAPTVSKKSFQTSNFPATSQKERVVTSVELSANNIKSHSTPYPEKSPKTLKTDFPTTRKHSTHLQSLLVPAITNSILSSLSPYTHSDEAYHQSTPTLEVPEPSHDTYHQHHQRTIGTGVDTSTSYHKEGIEPENTGSISTSSSKVTANILQTKYHETKAKAREPKKSVSQNKEKSPISDHERHVNQNTGKTNAPLFHMRAGKNGHLGNRIMPTKIPILQQISTYNEFYVMNKTTNDQTNIFTRKPEIKNAHERQNEFHEQNGHKSDQGHTSHLSAHKSHHTRKGADRHLTNEHFRTTVKNVDSYANVHKLHMEHQIRQGSSTSHSLHGDKGNKHRPSHSLHHSHSSSHPEGTKSKSLKRFSSPWKNIDLSSVLPNSPEPKLRRVKVKTDESRSNLNVFSFVAQATDPFDKIKGILKNLKGAESSLNDTTYQSSQINDETSFNFELTLQSDGNGDSSKHNEEDNGNSNGKNDTADELVELLSSTIQHAAKAYDMEKYKDEVIQKISRGETSVNSNKVNNNASRSEPLHHSGHSVNGKNVVDSLNGLPAKLSDKNDKYATISAIKLNSVLEVPTLSKTSAKLNKTVPYAMNETYTSKIVSLAPFTKGNDFTKSSMDINKGIPKNTLHKLNNLEITSHFKNRNTNSRINRTKPDLFRKLTSPPDLGQILTRPNITEKDRTRYIRTQIVQDIINTKSAFPTTPKSVLFDKHKERQPFIQSHKDMLQNHVQNQPFNTKRINSINDRFTTKETSRREIQHEVPISKALYLIKQQASALRSQNSFEDLTRKNQKEGFNNEFNAMLILSIDDILSDHTNLHGALVVSFLSENKNTHNKP